MKIFLLVAGFLLCAGMAFAYAVGQVMANLVI